MEVWISVYSTATVHKVQFLQSNYVLRKNASHK